ERLCPPDDQRIFQNFEVAYGCLPGHLRRLGDLGEIKVASRPFRNDSQDAREALDVAGETLGLDLLFQIRAGVRAKRLLARGAIGIAEDAGQGSGAERLTGVELVVQLERRHGPQVIGVDAARQQVGTTAAELPRAGSRKKKLQPIAGSVE